MKPKPITHILAATDFSVCADRALEYAAFLAEACSAPLDILHAVEIPPDMDSEEAAAGRFFEQRRKEAEEPMERLVRRLASAGAVATCARGLASPASRSTQRSSLIWNWDSVQRRSTSGHGRMRSPGWPMCITRSLSKGWRCGPQSAEGSSPIRSSRMRKQVPVM